MKFILNGEPKDIEIREDETAIEVIRENLRLKGTKMVCGQGACGACTIIVDGKNVLSCLLSADHLEGKSVQTAETWNREKLHPIHKAFMACDGLQCGYCTPGMINSAIVFFEKWRAEKGTNTPSKEDIIDAMSGHLCRCGAYPGIFEAISKACSGEYDNIDSVQPKRIDALEKVTGEAQFTSDVHFDHQLIGVFVRSKHAHARVKSIDIETALDFPGVLSIINLLEEDQIVRYVGQEILAIAVTDRYTAEQAKKFIGIEYDLLPIIATTEQALDKAATKIYPNKKSQKKVPNAGEGEGASGKWRGNQLTPSVNFVSRNGGFAKRSIKVGVKKQDPLTIEDTWTTSHQIHTPFEPHVCMAKWENNKKVTIFLSTQANDFMARAIAKKFELEPEQVQVICKHVGGAFGSKLSLTMETIAAIRLSRNTDLPVKVELSRTEEMALGGSRPSTSIDLGLRASKDGKLKSLKAIARTNSGVAVSSNSATLMRLIYPGINKYLQDIDVVTNLPPSKPFRAPGAPQASWALEQAVDYLALQLNKSPMDVRKEWDKHKLRQKLFDKAQNTAIWRNRPAHNSQNSRFRKGVGMASGNWLNLYHPKTQIRITASAKGVSAISSTQDMGNGTHTLIAKTIADVFGVQPTDVIVYIGNSKGVQGPLSGGSRTTNSLYYPTREAAEKVKNQLLAAAVSSFNIAQPVIKAEGIQHSSGFLDWRALFRVIPTISETETRGTDTKFDLLAKIPLGSDDVAIGRGSSGGVYISEIEVDTWTGKITVKHVWGGIAAGKIVVPDLALSQCHGGIIQGIGFALYEERQTDPNSAHILSLGLEDYKIPGFGDVPKMDVFFLEEGFDKVKGQAVGIGEIATIPVAASIGNAVFNATGWQPKSLPIKPGDVLQNINK